jgi:hypothetical protein
MPPYQARGRLIKSGMTVTMPCDTGCQWGKGILIHQGDGMKGERALT